MRNLFLLFFFIILNSGCMETFNGSFDAALINSRNQELLYLQNNRVHNSSGQILAYFDGNDLMNNNDQKIGSIENENIFNFQGQVIGSVQKDELLNSNGQKIMQVTGTSFENKVKVSAYFFFM